MLALVGVFVGDEVVHSEFELGTQGELFDLRPEILQQILRCTANVLAGDLIEGGQPQVCFVEVHILLRFDRGIFDVRLPLLHRRLDVLHVQLDIRI